LLDVHGSSENDEAAMDIEEVVRDIEEAVRLLDSETAMATEATRVVSARDAAAAVFR